MCTLAYLSAFFPLLSASMRKVSALSWILLVYTSPYRKTLSPSFSGSSSVVSSASSQDGRCDSP